MPTLRGFPTVLFRTKHITAFCDCETNNNNVLAAFGPEFVLFEGCIHTLVPAAVFSPTTDCVASTQMTVFTLQRASAPILHTQHEWKIDKCLTRTIIEQLTLSIRRLPHKRLNFYRVVRTFPDVFWEFVVTKENA